MQKFKSMVDIDLLYDVVKNDKEKKRMRKLLQESTLITNDRRILDEAYTKMSELQSMLKQMSTGKLDDDEISNVVPGIISWANDNVVKSSDKKIKGILLKIKVTAKGILSKSNFKKLEKAGAKGRSGRQKGYAFNSTKHPRGPAGKFRSKGQAGSGKKGQEYRVTETGKTLPHYDIVEGKRVGRGIKRVPERFTPAVARIAGHVVSSAVERATGEPIKAGQMAASRVRSKHRREIGIREALKRELASPKTPPKEKKKIIQTLNEMERRRERSTGRSKPTTIGRVSEQLSEGLKVGAKSLPYSLTVGAVQGALRGLVERFRTNPMLAPLDIRVRPDILESGLRAGVAALGHRNIERANEMVESAREAGRVLSPEEYGQVAYLLKLPKAERQSIMQMADGLTQITGKGRLTSEDIKHISRIENQLDDAIGDYLVEDVTREISRSMSSESHATRRQLKRTKGKADIPAVKLTPENVGRAEELYVKLKGKKKGKK